MRYLGNKTKLLPAIEAAVLSRTGSHSGVLLDLFSGTASVSRRMKSLGWRVIANDNLRCAAIQAEAAIGLDQWPIFDPILRRPDVRGFVSKSYVIDEIKSMPIPEGMDAESSLPMRSVLVWLNRSIDPTHGLVSRQYSGWRQFFTSVVARHIDGAIGLVKTLIARGYLDKLEASVIMASLIDGVDRVANTTGTYSAYLKGWHHNSSNEFLFRPVSIVPGRGSTALCGDANVIAATVRADVAYLDPPYNERQYSKCYHVLETIVKTASMSPEEELEYESRIGGVSGAVGVGDDLKSDYCMKCRAETSLFELIRNLDVEHVIMSYSEEGIITKEALSKIFALTCNSFDPERDFKEVSHKRYRSDATKKGRRYKKLKGRRTNRLKEWIVCGRRKVRALT